MTPEEHNAYLDAAEGAIALAAAGAFAAWLPLVAAAVIHDGIVDPAAATGVSSDWDTLSEEIVAAALAIFLLRHAAEGGRNRRAAGETFADQIRSRLQRVRGQVFDRLDRAGRASDHSRIRDAVDEALDPRTWDSKALEIGRTEAITAWNSGAMVAWSSLPVRPLAPGNPAPDGRTKTWLSLRDGRVRHTHRLADGQVVPLASKFTVGGFDADFPGDPNLPAHEAAQCRCVVILGGDTSVIASGAPMTYLDSHAAGGLSPETLTERGLPNGWRGVMAALDVPTGDERMLATPEGGIRTRALPMSFRWAPAALGGHEGAVMAGRIDRVWVEEGLLMGEGGLDVGGADGSEFARQLGSGFAFTVSIDPDQVTFEQKFYGPDGAEVMAAEAIMRGDEGDALKGGHKALAVMVDWRLAAVTAVSIPALDEARIGPVWDYVPAGYSGQPTLAQATARLHDYDGGDEAELLSMARAVKDAYLREMDVHDGEEVALVAAVTGNLSFPVFSDRKRKWNGHTARRSVAKWASSDGSGDMEKINVAKMSQCFLYRGAPKSGNSLDGTEFVADGGLLRVEDWKLGFVDIIDGKPYIVANAIIGLAGGHGVSGTNIPSGEKRAAFGKLKALYAKAAKTFPDFPAYPFDTKADIGIVAAAVGGQIFNGEFFVDPKLIGPTPLTVTEEGHVYGHIAQFDSCYMAQGGSEVCLNPPRTGDYSRFLCHGAKLDDGTQIQVGALTFGEGHRSHGGLRAAMAAYADIASVAAKVICGEDRFGVWVSGEVVDAFRDHAYDLLLSPPSGHWEPDLDVGGQLRMIAAHVVVTPGFHTRSLVASFDAEGALEALEIAGPQGFLDTSSALFDEAVAAGRVTEAGVRYDGVTLRAPNPELSRAFAALEKLGLGPNSRAKRALARLGVSD